MGMAARLVKDQRMELYDRYMNGESMSVLMRDYGIPNHVARAYVMRGHAGTLDKMHEHYKYTVINNKTGECVAEKKNARECADAMEMSLNAFYVTMNKTAKGKMKKWTIIKEQQ